MKACVADISCNQLLLIDWFCYIYTRKVSAWLGCCIIMIGNSTSQKHFTGWWQGHLIQTFRPNPGSSSVIKDVTKTGRCFLYTKMAGIDDRRWGEVWNDSDNDKNNNNVWIKWPRHCPVKLFWLVEFPIIIIHIYLSRSFCHNVATSLYDIRNI